MKWIQKIMGGLAMTLGVLGFAACLAGLVGVWVINQRIQRPTEEILGEISSLCVQGASGADQVAVELESSRDLAKGIHDLVQQTLREALELTDDDIAQIESLYDDLQVVVHRVRDWIGLAQSSLDFLDRLIDIASSTFGYIQADSSVRADLGNALQDGAQKGEEAVLLLDQVYAKVLAIQAHDNPAIHIDEIETLSSKIDGVLVFLKEKALTFAADMLGLGEAIEHLHAFIKRALLLLACGLSFLLLWQAAAQTALVLLGRKMISGKSPAPAVQALPIASDSVSTVPPASTVASKRHKKAKKRKKRRK